MRGEEGNHWLRWGPGKFTHFFEVLKNRLATSLRIFCLFRPSRSPKGCQKRKTEKAKGRQKSKILQNREISVAVKLKMCTWRLHTLWIPKTNPNIIQVYNSAELYVLIAHQKWIHIWKALLFLRRMPSVTTLSAHLGFSIVYSGFGLQNEPRHCMKIVETYLKRSELSASNAINLTFLERNEIDSWVELWIIFMYA